MYLAYRQTDFPSLRIIFSSTLSTFRKVSTRTLLSSVSKASTQTPAFLS
jgi:hypothetical protein